MNIPNPRIAPYHSLRVPALSGPGKELCTNEAGNQLDRTPTPLPEPWCSFQRGGGVQPTWLPLSPALSGSILPSTQRHFVYLLTGPSLVPGCLAPLWAGISFSN